MAEGIPLQPGLVVWALWEGDVWWPARVLDPAGSNRASGVIPRVTGYNRLVKFFYDDGPAIALKLSFLVEFTKNMGLLRRMSGEERMEAITACGEAQDFIREEGSRMQRDLLERNPFDLDAQMRCGPGGFAQRNAVVWALRRDHPWWPAVVRDPTGHVDPRDLRTHRYVEMLDHEHATAIVHLEKLCEFNANMEKVRGVRGGDRERLYDACCKANDHICKNGLVWQVLLLGKSASGPDPIEPWRPEPRVSVAPDQARQGEEDIPPSPKRRCAEAPKKSFHAPGKDETTAQNPLPKTGLRSKPVSRDTRKPDDASTKPLERVVDSAPRSPKKRRDRSPSASTDKATVPSGLPDHAGEAETSKGRQKTAADSGSTGVEPRSGVGPGPSSSDSALLVAIHGFAARCDVWGNEYRVLSGLRRDAHREHGIRTLEEEIERKLADIMKMLDHLGNKSFSGSTFQLAKAIVALGDPEVNLHGDSGVISKRIKKIVAKLQKKFALADDPPGPVGAFGDTGKPVHPHLGPARSNERTHRFPIRDEVTKEGESPRQSPGLDKDALSGGLPCPQGTSTAQNLVEEGGDIPVPRKVSRSAGEGLTEESRAPASIGGHKSREGSKDENATCPRCKKQNPKETTKAASKEKKDPGTGRPGNGDRPEHVDKEDSREYRQLVSLKIIKLFIGLMEDFISINNENAGTCNDQKEKVRITMRMELKGRDSDSLVKQPCIAVKYLYSLHRMLKKSCDCRESGGGREEYSQLKRHEIIRILHRMAEEFIEQKLENMRTLEDLEKIMRLKMQLEGVGWTANTSTKTNCLAVKNLHLFQAHFVQLDAQRRISRL